MRAHGCSGTVVRRTECRDDQFLNSDAVRKVATRLVSELTRRKSKDEALFEEPITLRGKVIRYVRDNPTIWVTFQQKLDAQLKSAGVQARISARSPDQVISLWESLSFNLYKKGRAPGYTLERYLLNGQLVGFKASLVDAYLPPEDRSSVEC